MVYFVSIQGLSDELKLLFVHNKDKGKSFYYFREKIFQSHLIIMREVSQQHFPHIKVFP